MNPLFHIQGVLPLVLVAALLALLYWLRFCFRSPSWPKTIVKTGAVLALALGAVLAQAPALLFLALLLCALGDYLLSRPSERAFMAGVGAFAAGHFAYVALFLSHPMAQNEALLDMPQTGLIAGLVLFGLGMALLLWPRTGAMRIPVLLYIPIILSMGVAVLALPAAGPLRLALPAALLFILSDFTLALEKFVLPAGHHLHRVLPFIVWPTYWGAQLLFLLAFAAG